MPDDYTGRELTEAAHVLRDAVDVLKPASDVLMGTADELIHAASESGDTDRGEQAVSIARTARHLSAIALHLKSGELTLTRLAAHRPRDPIHTHLLGVAVAAVTLSGALRLLGTAVHLPSALRDVASLLAGLGIGVSGATYLIRRRTRPGG